MICPPCAEMADYVTTHDLNEGHPPEVCRDHGREIRACGCQHRPRKSPGLVLSPAGWAGLVAAIKEGRDG